MLSVTLYEFKKRENSTKRPDSSATQRTHAAVLKMPTSLLRPEISFDFGLKGNPSFYNYAYISDLGNRYYFIRDWTVSEGHIWTAHMEVDVLASWKASIGESTQYVLRSSAAFDGNILDNLYPAKVPAIFSKVSDTIFPVVSSITTGSYVVGIINNSSDAVGAVAYYVFTSSQFRNFMDYLLGDVSWAGSISDISEDLLKTLFNPMQYITTIMWYPDDAPKGHSIDAIPFGWWSVGVSASKLKQDGVASSLTVLEIPKHPQAAIRGAYLNLSPYTTLVLDSRVWGEFPLDTTALVNSESLLLEWKTDYITGISEMYLYSSSGNTVYDNQLAIRRGQYGVPIQIAQVGQNYLNTLNAVVGSAGAVTKSAISGDITGAITGAVSGITSVIESMAPEMSTTGNNGTIANFTKRITLYAKFMPLVDDDNEDRGRPLCKKLVLSTIPGYQMISDADIAIAGTAQENKQIKAYLESGYFYE